LHPGPRGASRGGLKIKKKKIRGIRLFRVIRVPKNFFLTGEFPSWQSSILAARWKK
jgi:hypothetical protein